MEWLKFEFRPTAKQTRACGKKIIGVDSSQYTPAVCKARHYPRTDEACHSSYPWFCEAVANLIQAAFVFLCPPKA